MEAPAPSSGTNRPYLYSTSIYCAFGRHQLLLEDTGVLLHRFEPGRALKGSRNPYRPRACFFTITHRELGQSVIMATHELQFEDLIHVTVRTVVL
jgi:hypothetical protein